MQWRSYGFGAPGGGLGFLGARGGVTLTKTLTGQLIPFNAILSNLRASKLKILLNLSNVFFMKKMFLDHALGAFYPNRNPNPTLIGQFILFNAFLRASKIKNIPIFEHFLLKNCFLTLLWGPHSKGGPGGFSKPPPP